MAYTTIPVEIWTIVQHYVPINPVLYQKLLALCRASRAVFISDALWQPLTPVDEYSQLAAKFFERIGRMGEQDQQATYESWRALLLNQLDSAINVEARIMPPDLALVRALTYYDHLLAARLRRGVQPLTDTWMLAKACNPKWLSDRCFVSALVQLAPMVLEILPTFADDPVVTKIALSLQGFALKFCSEAIRNDKKLVLAAVENDGMSLLYASPALQTDKEVVLAALRNNDDAIAYASRRLLEDPDIQAYMSSIT